MHKPSNTLQQVKEWLEKRSRFPFETMKKWDALYYIQQLEGEVAHYTSPKYRRPAEIELSNIVTKKKAKIIELESRLAQVERERDAAIRDCARFPCRTCDDKENGDLCHNCNVRKDSTRTNYEWRGVCEENTKEE